MLPQSALELDIDISKEERESLRFSRDRGAISCLRNYHVEERELGAIL
jgi:hypothetical protein